MAKSASNSRPSYIELFGFKFPCHKIGAPFLPTYIGRWAQEGKIQYGSCLFKNGGPERSYICNVLPFDSISFFFLKKIIFCIYMWLTITRLRNLKDLLLDSDLLWASEIKGIAFLYGVDYMLFFIRKY